MSKSLQVMLERGLAAVRQKAGERVLSPVSLSGVHIHHQGRDYLSFASNDYLGIAATLAQKADNTSVHGAGASRLVSGNHPDYAVLEQTIARIKGTQVALVFGSGYLANIGTIPALVGERDLVLMDRLSHACMIDGVRLSGAAWKRFHHNDMGHLETLLKTNRHKTRHCLILTETVFSMDGDRAPLQEMAALADIYDCWLMTDDAHGFGLPATYPNPAPIQMGSLSKAVGAYGGYVAGSHMLIEYLINHARSLIFSTALPVSVVNAALQGLEIMEREPQRAVRVMDYARKISNALEILEPQSPIIPVILGGNQRTLEAQQRLMEENIWVSAIRPPTVPEGTARLRISLSAAHTQEQVEQLIEVLSTVLA